MIEVREVSRRYHRGVDLVHALEGVSLRIPSGRFVALMGPSGSGKSTLLNLLAGLDRPDVGEVVVAGQALSRLDEDGLADVAGPPRRSRLPVLQPHPGALRSRERRASAPADGAAAGRTPASCRDRALGRRTRREGGPPPPAALGRRAAARRARPPPGRSRGGGRPGGPRHGRARAGTGRARIHDTPGPPSWRHPRQAEGGGRDRVPGGFAGSGDLIRMANLDDLRGQVDVTESELAKVRPKQGAELVPDAYPDRRYRAHVVKLYPQVDRQKGTLRVEVQIEEPDDFLWPDMSARITFVEPVPTTDDGRSGVLVPRAAVRGTEASPFAWVVVDGRVRRTPLMLGQRFDDRVQVTAGLAGGETVVVGEPPPLRDGQAVAVGPRP